MRRILFEKTGNGIWISHLDLMRVFQRAFRRAGLLIKHTQGFNPHAFVSLALPLSVGTVSRCEILQFDLPDDSVDLDVLPEKLNATLPDGIHCLEAYEGGKKLRELAFLQVQVELEYDSGVPEGAREAIEQLFARESLLVEKKSKNGMVEQDIRPMICSMSVAGLDSNTLTLDARICAQNPSLNPDLLAKAITVHLPQYAPDFARSTRVEVLDREGEVFR